MLSWLFTRTPLLFLTQSLWRDEAFSYFLAKKNILEIVFLSVRDFNPPLYHVLLHFWLKIFGGSEISLRSLSLIFYWATLYVCFLILTGIFKLSLKKSLIYLSLFLLNPFLTYYAFEARTYSLFSFLATLSYYSFFKKRFKLYYIAAILGLFTHYFMLFIGLSQLLYIYLIFRKDHRYESLKKVVLKPIFIFLPWLILVLLFKNYFTSSFWIEKTTFKTFTSLFGIVYTGFEKNIGWISLILFLFFALSLAKIINKKRAEGYRLLVYLMLWGVGVPVVVAIISFVKPIFFPRYFIFSTVGFILLLVYCLEKMKALLLIILLSIAINYQKLQIQKLKKTDFQKVAREIKVLAKKDDFIYVSSELDFFTAKYYFPENKVLIYYKTYEEIPDYVGKVLISENDIARALPNYPQKAFIIKSKGTYNIQALY